MGSEWSKRPLCEVATIIMGQSPPGSTYNEEGRGIPFFQGVKDFYSRYPRKRVFCTAPTRFAEPGDILFSVRAPIGEINRAFERCAIGRGLAAIRGGTVHDTNYIEYALRSIKHEWHILEGQGAVFGNAKRSDLENILIPWPDEKERHTIAHILGTLDDKIELNRRMNKTLEAMAQALFKSWFVDFDPVVVNALKAGNPIPEKFAPRAAHYQSSPLPLGEGLGVRAKKKPPLSPQLLAHARELRKTQTDAERLMWRLLRNRQFLGIKFRRQHPIEPYIVDFYAHELGLVIELDGSQHAEPAHKRYDDKRTQYLEKKGLKVIRYWSRDVLRETEAVLQDLYERVSEMMLPSPPAPLPRGEGSALGLPEHLLRLFPDRFVDSELGPIPEGWEVKALDEIAHFQNGLALQKYRPKPGEARLPVVKIAQLRSGRADSGEWASANIRGDCIIDDGDVVFSWSGSLLLKVWCGGQAALNQHLFKVTSEKYPKWFYFYWIAMHLPEFIRIASDKATTMGHIKRHHLSEAKCAIPDDPFLLEVNKHFENFLDQQIHNEIESRTLATLRDTLLPKLISGELRVPDVEKILEERGL